MHFSVVLPPPSSINRAYKTRYNPKSGKPQFYASEEYKTWKVTAWAKCKAARWPRLRPDTLLSIEYRLYSDTLDIDAGTKPLLDAVVQDVLGVNDKNVVELRAVKYPAAGEPRLEVTCRPIRTEGGLS